MAGAPEISREFLDCGFFRAFIEHDKATLRVALPMEAEQIEIESIAYLFKSKLDRIPSGDACLANSDAE